MNNHEIYIRNAKLDEFEKIGKLMVEVYSQLKKFPNETQQPQYYKMLRQIGEITKKPNTELLVAVSAKEEIVGTVVYFGDMRYYGSGGIATQEKNTSGFRLLAVSSSVRGLGIGKLLSKECIQKAREVGHTQMIIHTTKAMQIAWAMYEKLGFRRSEDLDFNQGELPVFGFRMELFHKTMSLPNHIR